MRVTLGAVGSVHEACSNVATDAASPRLTFNIAISTCCKEALNSSKAIALCAEQDLEKIDLPKDIKQVITTADRSVVGEIITMNKYVVMIAPHGGQGLVVFVVSQATVFVT